MPKHSSLLMLMFTINPQLIQYYSLLMYGRCQGQYIGGKLIINTNLKLSKLISNGEKEKNSTVRKETGVITMKHLGIFCCVEVIQSKHKKNQNK